MGPFTCNKFTNTFVTPLVLEMPILLILIDDVATVTWMSKRGTVSKDKGHEVFDDGRRGCLVFWQGRASMEGEACRHQQQVQGKSTPDSSCLHSLSRPSLSCIVQPVAHHQGLHPRLLWCVVMPSLPPPAFASVSRCVHASPLNGCGLRMDCCQLLDRAMSARTYAVSSHPMHQIMSAGLCLPVW